MLLLDEHLEAADWCARRVAATRDRALARVLKGSLERERASACTALAALREIDAAYAESLCRLLFPDDERAEWRALARNLAVVRAALERTVRRRSANSGDGRGERYGT